VLAFDFSIDVVGATATPTELNVGIANDRVESTTGLGFYLIGMVV
jgi:hypothetical protein